jgi:cell fate (sporulation/competence/biofilm development) regulator YlbF (YheA/YmcA/DUF963 family)
MSELEILQKRFEAIIAKMQELNPDSQLAKILQDNQNNLDKLLNNPKVTNLIHGLEDYVKHSLEKNGPLAVKAGLVVLNAMNDLSNGFDTETQEKWRQNIRDFANDLQKDPIVKTLLDANPILKTTFKELTEKISDKTIELGEGLAKKLQEFEQKFDELSAKGLITLENTANKVMDKVQEKAQELMKGLFGAGKSQEAKNTSMTSQKRQNGPGLG